MHVYEDIISLKNLCAAWQEFIRGKKSKQDVAEFSLHLSSNLFSLHEDLSNKSYKHGEYVAFSIADPKPRQIHKAAVRDRVLHHAVHQALYPFFDRTFIADSYSCRVEKGTHKALNRFREFGRKVSRNNARTCWVGFISQSLPNRVARCFCVRRERTTVRVSSAIREGRHNEALRKKQSQPFGIWQISEYPVSL